MDTPATRKEMGSKNSVLGVCSAQQRALPTIRFLSSLALDFRRRRGKRIYQRSRFIQSGLVSCPAESNEPRLAADLSEAPNIPPVVAKAPSQCGQSFKSGNPPTF